MKVKKSIKKQLNPLKYKKIPHNLKTKRKTKAWERNCSFSQGSSQNNRKEDMLARYSAVWVLKSESFFPPFLQNVFCKMESFFLFSKKKKSLPSPWTHSSVNSQLEKRREKEKYSWERVKVNVELHGMGFLFVWGGSVVANEVERVVPPLLRKKVHSTSSESFRFSLACLWLYLCLWYDALAWHLFLRSIFCVFTIKTFILNVELLHKRWFSVLKHILRLWWT